MSAGSFSIRLAGPDDVTEIAEVHVRGWQWAYRGLMPDDYLDSLSVETRAERRREAMERQPEQRTWVAVQGERIVGFAVTLPSRAEGAPPDEGELGAIYLLREAVGAGIGRALLTRAVDDLRERGYREAILWVLEGNDRARSFYARHGWEPDGAAQTLEWGGQPAVEVRYRIDLGQAV